MRSLAMALAIICGVLAPRSVIVGPIPLFPLVLPAVAIDGNDATIYQPKYLAAEIGAMRNTKLAGVIDIPADKWSFCYIVDAKFKGDKCVRAILAHDSIVCHRFTECDGASILAKTFVSRAFNPDCPTAMNFQLKCVIEGLGLARFVASRNPSLKVPSLSVPVSEKVGLGNFGSSPGFSESRPNQIDANCTKDHAYDGSKCHDVSPKSGLPLGYKIGLVILILGLCVEGIVKASDAFERGDADTGLGYLVAGITGIFAGIGVGLPFIIGGL